MPSGRRFPVLPCFGMYTRLTGWACHGSVSCCTQSTSSALASGCNTTFPSMPAVLRPALSSVTRRTLTSVFARDRSINFCRLRTLLRSPACVAVKIRCRRRRTSSSAGPPVDRVPVKEVVLRSVHHSDHDGRRRLHRRHGVQLVLRFRCHRHRFRTGSPDPRQHPFGSGHQPVSGQLSGTVGGGADHGVPVSCCLSATGIRFLGHPVPAGELGLPHGRLTGPCWCPDPDGVTTFRTHEIRPGWVPPVPRGRRCSTRPASNPRPAPAASQRPAPAPRLDHPIGGDRIDEASTEVHAIHPSGLPLTCGPRMEREPLGLTLSFAPRRYRRRTSGRGRTIEHWPGTTPPTSVGPPICESTRNVRPRVATCGTA